MSPDIRTSRQPRVPLVRLWLVLLLPVSAWLAQTLTSPAIASQLCLDGRPQAARLTLIVIAAVALVISATTTWFAFTAWRAVAGRGLLASEGYDREEMMSLGSVFMGLIFSLAIVWSGLPSIVLSNVCGIQR